MEKKSGVELLRARLNTPVLYQVFNVVFAVLIFGVLVLAVFFNTNSFHSFPWYGMLAAAVGGIVLSLLGYWLFNQLGQVGRTGETVAVILLLALLAGLLGFAGWQLRVQPGSSWDYGLVYQYASGRVLEGSPPGDYFLLHPQNAGYYALLCGFFSLLNLFGLTDFLLPSILLNCLVITLSVLLLYFACRRLFGVRAGLFLLVAACFTSPFLLYAPILYTDTLAMPFGIGVALLWLGGRSRWREGDFGGAMLRFCLLSGLAALGALLRVTVLIVWIAVVLDLLLLLCGKGRGLLLLAGTGALALVLAGGIFALFFSPLLPAQAGEGMPLSAGVMMGLSETGGYTQADYDMLLAAEGKAARTQLAADEIQSRLAELGPLGVLQHLGTKLSYTFGDGSYTALWVLDESPLQPDGLLQKLIYGGAFGLAYFAGAAAILFWMAMAALRSFTRRNEALVFLRVAVFGLVLFLLIWETQARYLVSFLPIFLLCAVESGPRPGRVSQHPAAVKEEEETLYDEVGEVGGTTEDESQLYPDYMNPAFQWEGRPVDGEPRQIPPDSEENKAETEPAQPMPAGDLFSMMQDE